MWFLLSGRFSVLDGQVPHQVEVSSDPNRVGSSIVRTTSWLGANQWEVLSNGCSEDNLTECD